MGLDRLFLPFARLGPFLEPADGVQTQNQYDRFSVALTADVLNSQMVIQLHAFEDQVLLICWEALVFFNLDLGFC
nr:hypothetical protein BaRGS_000906 [Batillaria attramentaria]